MSPYGPKMDADIARVANSPYFSPEFPPPMSEQEETEQDKMRTDRLSELEELQTDINRCKSVDEWSPKTRKLFNLAFSWVEHT